MLPLEAAMFVRITNAVLGTCCLLFVLAFGWIRAGALDTSAQETFTSLAQELDSGDSPPKDGDGSSAEGAEDQYADGCLTDDPEEWAY
jgi:hypothetical protein